ncbi:N-acetylmuramoyl-L-alanine amidase [Domibacillus epiphyticus]|uniref:MurNAc-LAA domain-containing protein n=1 Tax=Domibacillus epiphyticus TaxID=1714355 RepID=A0A1V2A573_9BACI|nr:N-acetylmuramoyl-L-alanine amidase [Domibacillus epiphyticus]OMP66169.1 hypothetical protein BTO28_13695 [Domibacillus epiphyticus]
MRIAVNAGHSLNTPGKRTPDGEPEWSFNDKVVRAIINELRTYEGVEILRTDDPSGKTDLPLKTRTNKAKAWGAEVYVSVHHNALSGKWGKHGGIETYTYRGSPQPSSERLASLVHPRLVKAMGLRDREHKKANFHDVRVFENEPTAAILTEGGFMDSTTDIKVMRDDEKLKAQGAAIAHGIALFGGLKKKSTTEKKNQKASTWAAEAQKWVKESGISDGSFPHDPVTRQEVWVMLYRLNQQLHKQFNQKNP